MAVYTYVVDHGMDSPRVGLKTEVNGGQLIVVAFGDLAKRYEELEDFVRKLRDETTDMQTAYGIDEFFAA
jgi:hypothetical protein